MRAQHYRCEPTVVEPLPARRPIHPFVPAEKKPMRASARCAVAALALAASACAKEPTGASTKASRPSAPSLVADLHATTIACGATLLTDLKLEADLTCSGDAIIVGADDIVVNLNGHTVAGSGAGIGITVRGRKNVSISNGYVRRFLTGMMIASSTDIVIKHNELTETREAIFLAGSSGNVIKNNVAWGNQLRGIMLRPTGAGALSTENDVIENVLIDNPSGILVFGQPGNRFTANKITGSSVGAIDLTGGGASGNDFRGNRFADGAVGIKFGPGWTGNTFLGNTLAGNVCGTEGSSAGNTLKGNNYLGNVTDVCP